MDMDPITSHSSTSPDGSDSICCSETAYDPENLHFIHCPSPGRVKARSRASRWIRWAGRPPMKTRWPGSESYEAAHDPFANALWKVVQFLQALRPLKIFRQTMRKWKVNAILRNPDNHTSIKHKPYVGPFLLRLLGFFVYVLLISMFHTPLGVDCASENSSDDRLTDPVEQGMQPLTPDGTTTPIFQHLPLFITLAGCVIAAQGQYRACVLREKMVTIAQTTQELVYYFLMTTTHGNGDLETLQLHVYECLALLTVFPVAMVHQINRNPHEIDAPTLCAEAAESLLNLKVASMSPFEKSSRFENDHFFQLFSLKMEKELVRTHKCSNVRSRAPQRILYSMRNHIENMVDSNIIDVQRAPFIRKSSSQYLT
ncbi:hypothetical protein G7046_g3352 [Stylonectria norvegica]|nr:hypothetical protein G7046_g3352 [Stylonectria norvegica]